MYVRQCILTGVTLARHGIDILARGREAGVHVRQLALQQLELANALVELLALVHIAECRIARRLNIGVWGVGG